MTVGIGKGGGGGTDDILHLPTNKSRSYVPGVLYKCSNDSDDNDNNL